MAKRRRGTAKPAAAVAAAAVALFFTTVLIFPSSSSQAGNPLPGLDQDRFFPGPAAAKIPNAADKDKFFGALRAALASARLAAEITVDYPFPQSIFPPDMVGPTFLFHDRAASALWLIDIAVAGQKGHILALADGRKPEAEIDPRCGTHTDEYQEPAYQASAKGWTADAEIWGLLTRFPETDITVAFHGLSEPDWRRPDAAVALLSRGTIVLSVSRDPVGAPIVYRDVPLMPTTTQQGVIKPLADGALPLVEWRLRDLARPASLLLMKDLPTCANCHSFSNDGKYLGLDMDGPSGDKGAYAFAAVEPKMVITQDRVFSWNAIDPSRGTFGLFSRVSPDGRYIVSTVRESMFVTNYMDFRFLQTFYPTRGLLAVKDRETGRISLLPGADDPRFVHTNANWTPDGRTLVFLRGRAKDSEVTGERPLRANDPNEVQIQYDICTIPFNEGRGGEARPLPGASGNGKSHSFPKVSPDGRWIVWVQAHNGLLMRPDSELYIMRLDGGTPRRMSCNLAPMNSWHSFSPNGRWLVFASKAFSPYTQMFLTHIDEEGNDSPAVLIPNSTAANRAVNIPEFAAIPAGGLLSIDAPAVDYRRYVDRGLALIASRDLAGAFAELSQAERMKPDYPEMLAALGYYYRETGDVDRAVGYFEKTIALDPRNWAALNLYGMTLFRQKKYDEAMAKFEAAIAIYPINSLSLANSLANMGGVEYARGSRDKAKAYFERALAANAQYVEARSNLAALLIREGKYAEAAGHYEKYLEIIPGDAEVLANLAWIYATCPQEEVRAPWSWP